MSIFTNLNLFFAILNKLNKKELSKLLITILL